MKQFLLVLMLALVVSACGDKNGKTDSKDGGGSSGQKHKFGVKSGIVEMKNSMMKDMKQTMYFDDYGNKQAMYVSAEMGGQKIENLQLTIDGQMTVIDLAKKTGKRMKAPVTADQTSFSSMTDSMKKAVNLQEIEGKEVVGKQTKGYSMDMGGSKAKIWAYEDIPLYFDISMSGQPMIIEAISFQEVDVPAEKFVIPADIKIEDETAMPSGAPPAGGDTAAGAPPPAPAPAAK